MFLAGDIVGTAGDHWISRAIRWATRRKWEPPSVVNHTEIVVSPHYDARQVETVAAIGGKGVVRHTLGEAYGGTGTRVEIWRADNFDEADRELIAMTALHFVGQRYPWHRLIFQLADEVVFGGRFIFRRLAIVPGFRICTPLAVEAVWPTGKHFGMQRPTDANPDNLRDFLEANPDKYRIVHKLQEIERCLVP